VLLATRMGHSLTAKSVTLNEPWPLTLSVTRRIGIFCHLYRPAPMFVKSPELLVFSAVHTPPHRMDFVDCKRGRLLLRGVVILVRACSYCPTPRQSVFLLPHTSSERVLIAPHLVRTCSYCPTPRQNLFLLPHTASEPVLIAPHLAHTVKQYLALK